MAIWSSGLRREIKVLIYAVGAGSNPAVVTFCALAPTKIEFPVSRGGYATPHERYRRLGTITTHDMVALSSGELSGELGQLFNLKFLKEKGVKRENLKEKLVFDF